MAGNLRAFLAELAGTFAWVFFGAGAVCADAASGGRLGPLGLALSQGLTVAFVFGLFGRHSPGLFNPAFAWALAATRRLDPARAALALVCQLFGAALAGLLLAQLFSHTAVVSEPPYLGAPMPSSLLGFRGATLLEAVLTFFLALAAYGAFGGGSDPGRWGTRALVLGTGACVCALVGGPLSGAILNPARAFGPAVASGYWTQHYVYWVGPAAGALLGMGLAHALFER